MKSAKAVDIVDLLHRRYPIESAEEWDRVGVSCGDLSRRVVKIYFAVDVLPETVAEAIKWGADLFIAHHPLFLYELHEPEPDKLGDEHRAPKAIARWKIELSRQIEGSGAVLLILHSNADIANPGVSDALAKAIGLINITEMPAGLGRIGELLHPQPLQKFIAAIAQSIPVGVNGICATGAPELLIKRVAVCGGSGDDRFELVKTLGVDAYLTADLRHHRVNEALADGAPVLIDGGHFATEWPWLPQAAGLLAEDLAEAGYAPIEMKISEISTDPWRVR